MCIVSFIFGLLSLPVIISALFSGLVTWLFYGQITRFWLFYFFFGLEKNILPFGFILALFYRVTGISWHMA